MSVMNYQIRKACPNSDSEGKTKKQKRAKFVAKAEL